MIEEIHELLEKNSKGSLALIAEDAYPYTYPVNFRYKDGKLYINCQVEGNKLESIGENDKLTLSVFTDYKSVIIRARARLDDEATKDSLSLEIEDMMEFESRDLVQKKELLDLKGELIFKNKAKKQLAAFGISEEEFILQARIDEFFEDSSMKRHKLAFPLSAHGKEYMVYGRKNKDKVTIEKIDKYYL